MHVSSRAKTSDRHGDPEAARRRLLREHLIGTRLSGSVATSPGNTLSNCGKLIAGEERYTFGLSDYRTSNVTEAVDAVRTICGGDPGGAADRDGPGWIDPDATLMAIEVHRHRLAALVRSGGGRVLIATGHPTGLLGHYTAIARALQQAGCALLMPLDDVVIRYHEDSGRKRGVRFVDGVGCVHDGASLLHSHRSVYMEAMLDELGTHYAVDLVIADHGMAGTAIEHGLPTLSIADVNDPALPLAQVRGRTDAVLPIDDNLAPRLFVPVTNAMLDWQ
ncbi:MAG: hypothetical protein GEU74_05480 [Nitriliruptorales bacterium]|nr:hypothetical protein [Nitriliruptorales bacterium]